MCMCIYKCIMFMKVSDFQNLLKKGIDAFCRGRGLERLIIQRAFGEKINKPVKKRPMLESEPFPFSLKKGDESQKHRIPKKQSQRHREKSNRKDSTTERERVSFFLFPFMGYKVMKLRIST